MGKSVVLKCSSCGREVNIHWGQGFYMSANGNEACCGENEQNGEGGIVGFWVDKICKDCGEVLRESRYIEDTTEEYSVAWMSFPRVDIIEKCTSCESKDILTMYEVISEDVEIPCSHCNEGKLIIKSVI